MSDRLFFSLAALTAVLMIALALVWPQGLGARSPWPFGHTPYSETPAGRQALARETAGPRPVRPTHAAVAGLRAGQ